MSESECQATRTYMIGGMIMARAPGASIYEGANVEIDCRHSYVACEPDGTQTYPKGRIPNRTLFSEQHLLFCHIKVASRLDFITRSHTRYCLSS